MFRGSIALACVAVVACRSPKAADPQDTLGTDTQPAVDSADSASPDDTDVDETGADSDTGVRDTDTGATDPPGWDWAADNDENDADASFLGTPGDMAGACLAGIPDADGQGGEDLLVGGPEHDSNRGRAFLVAGQTSGWALGTSLSAFPFVVGQEPSNEICRGVARDLDGDGLSDVVLPKGYNTYVADGGTPIVRGGTWSGTVPVEAWLENDDELGAVYVDPSIPLGDVDGDHTDDLLVFSTTYGGEAMVVPASTLHGDVEVPSAATLRLRSDGTTTRVGEETGDVDGDGAADFVAYTSGRPDGDVAYVVSGAATSSGPVSFSDAAMGTIACVDRCWAEVVGDVDEDGRDDVWVNTDTEGWLFLGRDEWGDLTLADADHTATPGLEPLVAVGDVDGDGHVDFAQGRHGGGVYDGDLLLWLGGGVWPANLDASDADAVIVGDVWAPGIVHDLTGRYPDVNGDGIDDLLLANPGTDVGGKLAAGAVSVFVGRSSWPATMASGDADVRFVGDHDEDWFGNYSSQYPYWLTFLDWNDDGCDDVVGLDRTTSQIAMFMGKPGP